MTFFIKRYLKLIGILALFVLVGACTSTDKQALTAEESVKIRATERWQALIEGKLETAYGYELPEYRKVFSYEQFRRSMRGTGIWDKAEVKSVACTETCVVTMQIHVTIKLARFDDPIKSNSLLEEKWMRDTESGNWFHLSSK
jgi:hypothetical protein